MRHIPPVVWRLMIAYALMMAGTSLMVLLAGIIGLRMAPSPSLATLPIALLVVGLAASTLPTGRLMHRLGRKRVFLAYAALAIVAAGVAMASLHGQDFTGFCAAALMIGWSSAAGHQYRFAALEAVPAPMVARATSLLLFGGILAAFIGPEIALRGRYLLATEFTGSYLLLVVAYVAGLVLLLFHVEAGPGAAGAGQTGPALGSILRSPVLMLAIAAAALGYGVMSLLMTATPISMHEDAGHSLAATKVVIQSHIAGMYLPSLAFPWLLARLGFRGMLWAGAAALGLTLVIAWQDIGFAHYWLALIVLGVGWNFLFLSGTNLLPRGYRPHERFRVQSVNDFLVFSVQALASLCSGWLLHLLGWQGLVQVCIPLLALFVLLLWRSDPQVTAG